jgi:hypothetical protein
MKVVNYNKDTKVSGLFPEIKKLGFCSPNAEMTPFVWNGRLMRLELCWGRNGNDYVIETTHSLIRDVKTGEVISRTAYGMCFTSGYLEGDTFYILATVGNGPRLSGDTIWIYSTKDLVNWEQRELFRREGWEFFNTSLTKGEDGYTLLLEVGSSPEDDPGIPFTAYFVRSTDMIDWKMLPFETAFPKDMYCGAPYMRFHNEYYYIFLLLKLPFRRYAHYIFRTKDFYEIEVGLHNPLLIPSNEDRLISENGKRVYHPEHEDLLRHGLCCNNCDIDMCEWQRKTYINYLTGNQLGTAGYMCEALCDMPIGEFLEGYFN